MMIFREKIKDKPEKCPYLQGRKFIREYFFEKKVDEEELSDILAHGWRKFGYYFFRPACKVCFECVPVRVIARDYNPTKSQKRVLSRNSDTLITVSDNAFTEERYRIYQKHSEVRFGQKTDREGFIINFCMSAAPSFVMEYRSENILFATGYLDTASNAINSVYFAFDPDYSHLVPGILSCIVEIDMAKKLGKTFYYPGYYVKGNSSMDYKIRFSPYQLYDWKRDIWTNII